MAPRRYPLVTAEARQGDSASGGGGGGSDSGGDDADGRVIGVHMFVLARKEGEDNERARAGPQKSWANERASLDVVISQLADGMLTFVAANTLVGDAVARRRRWPRTTWASPSCAPRCADAWVAPTRLGNRQHLLTLANRAVGVLEVEAPARAFHRLGDAGMVRGLERAAAAEDRRLLAGEIAALFGDYGPAQVLELTLGSARPLAALDMRRNLLHWEQALKLATALRLGAMPEISAAYAQQLESCGESDTALRICVPPAPLGSTAAGAAQLRATCAAGVARCTLRLNDVRRSVALAWAAAAGDSGGDGGSGGSGGGGGGGGGGSYGVRLLRVCAVIPNDGFDGQHENWDQFSYLFLAIMASKGFTGEFLNFRLSDTEEAQLKAKDDYANLKMNQHFFGCLVASISFTATAET
ncbi:hypothetical protein JKP88DRAFT_277697 [Tribonema minus]|uniref:Uncharacterized protein n=1 Tax=Tribonema minus TaxID=303371 RepID=A0A835YXL7_9STRA|nr:hypothetical protein JKP88DRAFT_277697 [Tribonema minus]